MPVLILTARADWEERVQGIDAGADDYLPKPFQMAELLARLRALIRRSQGFANPIIAAGGVEIDTRTREVRSNGAPIKTTPLEYRCLQYLMMHRDRHISQLELTEQLWEDDFDSDSNSLEVLIKRLRKKFGKELIVTRRGYGYRIAGE